MSPASQDDLQLLSTAPIQASEEERMRALIDALAGYIEIYHQGSVKFVSFEGGTLKVKLLGACENCALSPITLHGWIEGSVRQFFPQVKMWKRRERQLTAKSNDNLSVDWTTERLLFWVEAYKSKYPLFSGHSHLPFTPSNAIMKMEA